jgi:hypothetical protein
MAQPDSQLWNFWVSLLGGGVVGAMISTLLAHRFNQERDRKARRMQFLTVVGEWRTKVNRCVVPAKIAKDFPADVIRFGGVYDAVTSDLWFWQRSKFHKICDDIVKMTDGEVERSGGKETLLKRIEAIRNFLL